MTQELVVPALEEHPAKKVEVGTPKPDRHRTAWRQVDRLHLQAGRARLRGWQEDVAHHCPRSIPPHFSELHNPESCFGVCVSKL